MGLFGNKKAKSKGQLDEIRAYLSNYKANQSVYYFDFNEVDVTADDIIQVYFEYGFELKDAKTVGLYGDGNVGIVALIFDRTKK